MDDFFELLGGAAEAFGIGEIVKGALGGRRDEAADAGDVPQAYVYERVLTRPRNPRVNDR
jgi:hypothetical protein